MSTGCPQCRSPSPLKPLDDRYAAELGGLTCHYLICSACRTISREVRKHELVLETALLIPMLVISLACCAVGTYLWMALHLHGKMPFGFLLTAFTLQAGAAFAISVSLRKLQLLHSRTGIVPIGELIEA